MRRSAMRNREDKRSASLLCRSSETGVRGFTLLELAIVITIIIILATMGAARYQQAVEKAREAALRQDLAEMRKAIQNYTRDKEAAPNALDDLETAQYMKIPTDPITRQKSWNPETCDQLLSAEQQTTGICDVHSASEANSPFEGTPYSSW
jgi:general secretion pathway protein G